MSIGSLLVSSTSSDWSQLEEHDHSEFVVASMDAELRSMVDAYQHGLVVTYVRSGDVEPMVAFSTDLTDWWTIPGLDLCANRPC
jgi:hypothetical protein